jgi:hypothetical protein
MSKEILLTVDSEMILAVVTEYDNKYVTEADAEMLLGRIEEQVRDWFYENIHGIVEQEVDKHIHEVMNPKRGEK